MAGSGNNRTRMRAMHQEGQANQQRRQEATSQPASQTQKANQQPGRISEPTMVGVWGYHQGDDGVGSNKTMKTVESAVNNKSAGGGEQWCLTTVNLRKSTANSLKPVLNRSRFKVLWSRTSTATG
jgi:hypothetical protein